MKTSIGPGYCLSTDRPDGTRGLIIYTLREREPTKWYQTTLLLVFLFIDLKANESRSIEVISGYYCCRHVIHTTNSCASDIALFTFTKTFNWNFIEPVRCINWITKLILLWLSLQLSIISDLHIFYAFSELSSQPCWWGRLRSSLSLYNNLQLSWQTSQLYNFFPK